MTVIEIVLKFLVDNSFDGLFDDDTGCMCSLAHLACCTKGLQSYCQPGVYYRRKYGMRTMGTREDAAKCGKFKRPSVVPRSNRDGGTVGYDPMPGDGEA